MSASPTKAVLGEAQEATEASVPQGDELETLSDPPSSDNLPELPAAGREALQALLAFSSLHQQIRARRAQEAGNGTGLSPKGAWELDQFVLGEVLQLVAERALAITGADGVAIALAEGSRIVCRGSAGRIAPDTGARLDPNSGFSGACFRTAQVVRCDDTENDPRVNVHACRRLGTRSMVAIPLRGRESVIGLLEAFSTEAYGFNDSDVHSLTLLAELILGAIKPEEEARLEEVSRTISSAAIHPEIREYEVHKPEVRVRLTTDEQQDREQPSGVFTPSFAVESSRPGLTVVLAVLLVALLCGAGLWWITHRRPALSMAVQPAPTQTSAEQPDTNDLSATFTDFPDVHSAAAIREKLAVLPQVTGIRHWSTSNSSTVVIDLQDQVQYEAHRLASPDRIYFDLHDTALAGGLMGRVIDIGDSLLVRIRIAQPMPGVTRLVLETTGDSNFSVSLESNPYRLVVEIRAVDAPKVQAKAQFDLFAWPPSRSDHTNDAEDAEDLKLRARVPKFRIVLDAGHGGWDLGTVGRQGLLEKDLVLDVANRLGELLSKRLHAEVIYTRQDDSYIPLEDRAAIANQAQADFFVAIHANYSDDVSARGVETYYTNTFSSVNAHSRGPLGTALQNVNWGTVDIRAKVQQSRQFATSIQRALCSTLTAKNPAIRDRGVKQAQYVVLTGTLMPAVLVEVSFVSSPSDESKMQNAPYRDQIASALYKGIERYVAAYHGVKMASTSGKPAGQ